MYRLRFDDAAIGLGAGIAGVFVLLFLAAVTGGEGDGGLLILWLFPAFALVRDGGQEVASHGVGLMQGLGGVAATAAPLLAFLQWFCYALILRHISRSGRLVTTIAVVAVVLVGHLGLGFLASLFEQ